MTIILILYIPDGTNINIIFKAFQIVLVLHNLPNRNKAVHLFEAFILPRDGNYWRMQPWKVCILPQ